MSSERERARHLARAAIREQKPTQWFEQLYGEARGCTASIPWADLRPNPNLLPWLEKSFEADTALRVLIVGCGLGDDAEALSGLGHHVTAFDVSPSAIEWCRERFPNSSVTYEVADLLDPPNAWQHAFDLVIEIYTLQVLPRPLRHKAQSSLASLVDEGGTLLIIARGRDPEDPEGEMPWPLLEEELFVFESMGLRTKSFEDFQDPEEPEVRRFRATFSP